MKQEVKDKINAFVDELKALDIEFVMAIDVSENGAIWKIEYCDQYFIINLMRQLALEASKELLELQEKIRTIDKANVPRDDDSKSQVTNNLFVGSTHELQKMIENMRNRNIK
jgi:hypothetical protein